MNTTNTFDNTTPVGTLIPYYMQNGPKDGGQEFFRFNDITKWGDISTINSTAASYDPFSMNSDLGIPSAYVKDTGQAEGLRKLAN